MARANKRGAGSGSRPFVLIAAAGTAIVTLGFTVGVLAGDFGDADSTAFGSLPRTISTAEQTDDIAPLPQAPGVPPLETTVPERTEEAEPEYIADEPEYEYQPPAEEKETYVPPPTPEPTPSPDVTIGKNE